MYFFHDQKLLGGVMLQDSITFTEPGYHLSLLFSFIKFDASGNPVDELEEPRRRNTVGKLIFANKRAAVERGIEVLHKLRPAPRVEDCSASAQGDEK